MSGAGVMSARELVEEELVYGALRREQLWRMIGLSGAGFGVFGCLTAAAVALMVETPPPVVVPYDPATGMALPNATVETVSLAERPAVIEAQIYRYLLDRETYNQLDNDLRVRRVLSQSSGSSRGQHARHVDIWVRRAIRRRDTELPPRWPLRSHRSPLLAITAPRSGSESA